VTKKILFRPMSEYSNSLESIPLPATNHIPQWYKDQKLFSNGENTWLKANKKDPSFVGTYKLCVPIVDSISAGYIISTTSDIFVENTSDSGYLPKFFWKTSNTMVDIPDEVTHKSLGNYPVPEGYSELLTRWVFDWQIITPPGYSLWITHPSHRFDLPFFSVNAFVDTDKHPSALRFPFFVKNGFVGIIPAGTPVVQVIPIKRDSWKSEKIEYVEKYAMIAYNLIKEKMVRAYKVKYWSKKSYR
jgi:hypothetical protein